MKDQTVAIKEVLALIERAKKAKEYINADDSLNLLNDIESKLQFFLRDGIDYKEVVDALDDSIFITDKDGVCMYVNPAHRRNTAISPEEILGRNVEDIIKQGNLFVGGATLEVLKQKKKVTKLATVTKTNPSRMGLAVGTPIFDGKGHLHQVVVSSRPVYSLKELADDYGKFLAELNAMKEDKERITIIPDGKLDSNRLVGFSYCLKKVWTTIELAAPTDATVLLTGESGVGKEVVADEIFRLSKRSNKTFVKVNCASIPPNLLESELFGYEKGAFSGANSSGKQGLFEMANGGTLLLDEIGDMPMDLQVKLLRAIQNKEITRVGGTKPIKLDIRFIAATNCDLKKKIAEGTFRQDLYFRLKVIPIYIPPLRERLADLEELCSHFQKRFSEKHGKNFKLSPSQIDIMKRYQWPGNIRELENVIEYMTICSNGITEMGDEMLKNLLEISVSEDNMANKSLSGFAGEDHRMDYTTLAEGNVSANTTLAQAVENFEKALIQSVLAKSKNLRDAGALLGVNASTISRKIKQYSIDYQNTK